MVIVLSALGFAQKYLAHRPTSAPSTFTVQQGPVQAVVHATAKLQYSKYADVGPASSAEISQLQVAIGDDIKAGKLLYNLAPKMHGAGVEHNQADLMQLRAEQSALQAEYDYAELQFKRQTQLKSDNATREDAYEASRTSLRTTSSRLDAINAKLKIAESTLKESEQSHKFAAVVAPISGTVVLLPSAPGSGEAGKQNAIMRIADLSNMVVKASVAEADITRIHKGMTAYFSLPSLPDQKWTGKVLQILFEPEEASAGKGAFYGVLFEIDNADHRLLYGMNGQADVLVSSVADAVWIPPNYIHASDVHGELLVTVRANGDVQQRKVQTGIKNDQQVQIVSGLKPGELVVAQQVGESKNEAAAN